MYRTNEDGCLRREAKDEDNPENLMNVSHNRENGTMRIRRHWIIEDDFEDEPSSRRRQLGEEQLTFLIEETQEEDHLEEGTRSTENEGITREEDDPINDPTFDPERGSVQSSLKKMRTRVMKKNEGVEF